MEYKSLKISWPTKTVQPSLSKDLVFETQHTLSFLRGQSFFTSGFTVTNNNGKWLYMADEHYNRLSHCFTQLFDQSSLPFTYKELIQWINQAISLNKESNKTLNILVVCSAGKARSVGTNNEKYVSGFGGELAEIMIVVNEHLTKPEWSFETGINIITQGYQRPVASAKPTNYLGGIQADFVIQALNTILILDYLVAKKENNICDSTWFLKQKASIYKTYMDLSYSQRQTLRLLLTDIRKGQVNVEQKLDQNSLKQTALASLFNKSILATLTPTEISQTEEHIFPNLIQECVFTYPRNPNMVLEGSTFSLMYINKHDELVFPFIDHELDLNKHDLDDSDGKILESTTMLSLYKLAKKYQLPSRLEKITLEQLLDSNIVFAISSTRMLLDNNNIRLQKINSINGIQTSKKHSADSDVYKKLIKLVSNSFETYKYDLSPQVYV